MCVGGGGREREREREEDKGSRKIDVEKKCTFLPGYQMIHEE